MNFIPSNYVIKLMSTKQLWKHNYLAYRHKHIGTSRAQTQVLHWSTTPQTLSELSKKGCGSKIYFYILYPIIFRLQQKQSLQELPHYKSGIVLKPAMTRNTQIQPAFTVFGLLLTEPQLHQRRTLESCNRYTNCASKMYHVLFLCIQLMNGCEPQSWDMAVLLSGTLQ